MTCKGLEERNKTVKIPLKDFFKADYPMKIFVKVRPGAKQEKVESADGTHLTVSVRAQAHEGKANDAVIKALAAHFAVAPSRVTMISGYASRQKIFEIL